MSRADEGAKGSVPGRRPDHQAVIAETLVELLGNGDHRFRYQNDAIYASALAALGSLVQELQAERLAVVKGVLDLMQTAGLPQDEIEPDALMPFSNGYSCWFIGKDQLDTAPLSEAEILALIDARAALASSAGRETETASPFECFDCGAAISGTHVADAPCPRCGSTNIGEKAEDE